VESRGKPPFAERGSLTIDHIAHGFRHAPFVCETFDPDCSKWRVVAVWMNCGVKDRSTFLSSSWFMLRTSFGHELPC